MPWTPLGEHKRARRTSLPNGWALNSTIGEGERERGREARQAAAWAPLCVRMHAAASAEASAIGAVAEHGTAEEQ